MSSDEFKAQGNEKFAAGEFDAAVELYTAGIGVDGTNHVLFGNRCACHLALDRFEPALADAEQATALNAKWVKGHFRKGVALMGLERYREAHGAFSAAAKLERRRNPELQSKMSESALKAKAADRRMPITGIDDWQQRFAALSEMRLRLGLMAHFWNLASQPERHVIFRRFLDLIPGGAAAAREFAVERMVPLPMKNYGDLEFPPVWTEHFSGIGAEEKLATMEKMYTSCSDSEQALVLQDLRHFMQPSRNCAAAAAAST